MLMLRLARGIEFSDFAARTGVDARAAYAEPLGRLHGLGLIQIDDHAARLTRAGLDVADAVSAEFLA
jgi:coproporphyrinogen III oxidase-like Fe-S oxidoreductase